jgi:pimeloyl-ACP methyl ester carboxylesterase
MRMQVADTALLHRPGGDPHLPLVLLHGIGSAAGSWARLLAALDPAITAFAWDAPGYGDSAPLAAQSPGADDYAARLASVLDALAAERVVLAGHSLGALFAGRFAATRPARVAALALLSPAAGGRVPAGGALPAAMQARLDDLARLGPAAFAAARASRLLARPAEQAEVLADVTRVMAAVRPAGYAQAVRALAAGDLVADAARIAAPTLIAVGAEDRVTPPAQATSIHAALRRPAGLHVVPACGHALPQEVPETAAALLGALWREARDGRA